MPIPTSSSMRIPRRLHRDEVHDRLSAAILDGTLEPAERIRDSELEVWLSVSRTPIRMALARLEDTGLVETTSHRNTRVVPTRPWLVPGLVGTIWAAWALVADDLVDAGPAGCAALLDELDQAVVRCAAAPAGGVSAAAVAETLRRVGAAVSAVSSNAALAPLLTHLTTLALHHASSEHHAADAAFLVEGLARARDAVAAGDPGAWRAAVGALGVEALGCSTDGALPAPR